MDLNKPKIIINLSFNFHFNYCPVINLRQASQFLVPHIKSVFNGSGSVFFLGVVTFWNGASILALSVQKENQKIEAWRMLLQNMQFLHAYFWLQIRFLTIEYFELSFFTLEYYVFNFTFVCLVVFRFLNLIRVSFRNNYFWCIDTQLPTSQPAPNPCVCIR